jgi:hypothetical protein
VIFRGIFIIFFFAVFQNSYVFIPLFLSEPLNMFCGTLRFCRTLFQKQWSRQSQLPWAMAIGMCPVCGLYWINPSCSDPYTVVGHLTRDDRWLKCITRKTIRVPHCTVRIWRKARGKFRPRTGWMVKATPLPFHPRKRDLISNVQEAGWASGPVWTCAENLTSTGIRSPDRPAHSESLYRLSYPGYLIWNNWSRCESLLVYNTGSGIMYRPSQNYRVLTCTGGIGTGIGIVQ